MSPELADGFLTTGPPGKSPGSDLVYGGVKRLLAVSQLLGDILHGMTAVPVDHALRDLSPALGMTTGVKQVAATCCLRHPGRSLSGVPPTGCLKALGVYSMRGLL